MIAEALGRIVRHLLRRRRAWLAGLSVLAVLLALVASRLELRLDARDFLPDEPAGAPTGSRAVAAGSADSGVIAVVLEGDEEIPVGDVDRLFGALTAALDSVPGVRRVRARLSPAEERFLEEFLPTNVVQYLDPADLRSALPALERRGIREALAPLADTTGSVSALDRLRAERDPLGLLGVAARAIQVWRGVTRVTVIEGHFGLVDRTAFFLTVESATGLEDIATARERVDAVRGAIESARTDPALAPLLAGRRLYAAGRPVSFVSAYDTLYRDVVRVGIAATVVVFVLVALFLRRVVASLALFASVACGLMATAAMAAIAFGSVSLMAWVFIGMMIGLGVDFGIHIASHYLLAPERAGDRTDAVAWAVTRPGPAIVVGGVTSAAAFLSILVVPYPATREVAWLTTFGLLAILAASLTIVPLLLSFAAPSPRAGTAWSRALAPFARRASTVAAWPWAVLVLGALALAPTVRFEPHPWRLAVRGNPESARLESLSRRLGAAFTPIRIVSIGRSETEAIERDRAAVERLHSQFLRAGVANVESLARWLPSEARQSEIVALVRERSDLFSPERLDQEFGAAMAELGLRDAYLEETYLPLLTRSMNPDPSPITLERLRAEGLGDEIDRFLAPGDGGWVATSYVYLRRFPWSEGAVTRFLDVAEDARVAAPPETTLEGEALRSAAHARIIRRAVAIGTLLATVLVGGLLWLRFRRPSLVGLCLLPLACGLGAALLVVRLAGMELTLLSVTVAPLLVGIGVDDGIHVVDRLSRGEPLDAVIREVGPGMAMTTLTTIGALACLGLATFAGIRELGAIGAVGMLSCLLASLHLIPIAWRLVAPDRA